MTILDTLTNSFSLGTVVEQNTTDDSATTESDDSSLGQIFDSFLSLMQSDDSSDSSDTSSTADDLTSTLATITDPIESIQQGLMSALSLGSLGADTLADLTSDESIANLQNSFLMSLQANLFSTADTAVDAAVDEVIESTDLSSNIASLTYSFLGGGELGLNDVFDSINILNHVPAVADIYQDTMSTTVAPIAEIVGGYMYGGALGLGYAAANLAVENFTGKSIYSNVVDFFFDDDQQAALETTTEALAEGISEANDVHQFVTRSY